MGHATAERDRDGARRLRGGVGHAVVRARPDVQDRWTSPYKGDFLNEFDETFAVNLSNLTNVGPSVLSGTGTILDDDPPPTVSVGDVSLPEGDAGVANATFTVSLSAPSGKPISVDYASADGTAGGPGDYAGVSGTLSFAPGQTTKTVDVAVWVTPPTRTTRRSGSPCRTS